MIVSIGIFIALAIAVILYQKRKLPEWCMRKNSRNIFLMLLGVNSLAAYLFYVDQQAEFRENMQDWSEITVGKECEQRS